MAIVSTAKKDFSIVSDSEDLLNFVKERTLDKKVSESDLPYSQTVLPSTLLILVTHHTNLCCGGQSRHFHTTSLTISFHNILSLLDVGMVVIICISDYTFIIYLIKEFVVNICWQFKIRKEAMCGLAMIYKKHLNSQDVPAATRHAVTWIKDKILHGYYMTSMDDRWGLWSMFRGELALWMLGEYEH